MIEERSLETSTVDPVPLKRHIQASVASGILSRLATHPLDTLKTRVQNASASSPTWVTSWGPTCMDRLRAWYRGVSVAMGMSVPALATYLVVYDQSKAYLARHRRVPVAQDTLVHATAALLAEVRGGVLPCLARC